MLGAQFALAVNSCVSYLSMAICFSVVINSHSFADDQFIIADNKGTALLGADGQEIERISSGNGTGVFSRDRQWMVISEVSPPDDAGNRKATAVVQSLRDRDRRIELPLVWGLTGSSFQPIWSADGKRLLICEKGWTNGVRKSSYRIHELSTGKVTEFELPMDWWPSDWSADGKRLLISVNGRIAWVNMEEPREPEFITPRLEFAHMGYFSPDGRQILCMEGLRNPNDKRNRLRLSVFDLGTKKRTIVDEPGETYGHCWSPDGSKIAYTWQKSLDHPEDVPVRETFLMTVNVDGTDRKIITSRKCELAPHNSGRDSIVFFFHVHAWK